MKRKVSETAPPPSTDVTALNWAAREQIGNLVGRVAIGRLACSGPGVALLREAQAALQPDFPDSANKLNELISFLETAANAFSDGAAWDAIRRGALLLTINGETVVYLAECCELLSQFRARADRLSALALLHAKLPRPGRANINRPDRILPSRLAMVDHTDRRAGRLFTPAAHAVERGGEQLKLPGFGLERTRITPALPLALYDLGGGSSMERGHGAPLALRLWVESILAVGLTDRANPWPTVLEIPLRDLLRKLYPNKRRPRPNEYWPRLMQAVEILDSTRIPWDDPETGKGGLRRIVNVSDIPRGPGKLDDAVRIIVDLPPGSGKGPVVSPNLNRYGVQSAPLYRGLLNLAYTWFDPGRTRFPVRGGKHWLQVEDPECYERITDDLLIELFYPTSAQRERKVLANRARQDLDRLVKDGEARIVKGRLMPPASREGR